jgi:ATP-dependent exoDNAse (exonuclease V) beta subunit
VSVRRAGRLPRPRRRAPWSPGRLGVWLDAPDALEVDDPLELDGLSRWALRDDVLARLLEEEAADCSPSLALQRAAGRLPHGPLGHVAFGAAVSEARTVSRLAGDRRGRARHAGAVVDRAVGGWRLVGRVGPLFDGGLYEVHAGRLRAAHQLRLWARHLALHVAEGAGAGAPTSTVVGLPTRTPTDGRLTFAPVPDAVGASSGCWRSTRRRCGHPLPLLPDPSRAYVDAFHAQAHARGRASRGDGQGDRRLERAPRSVGRTAARRAPVRGRRALRRRCRTRCGRRCTPRSGHARRSTRHSAESLDLFASAPAEAPCGGRPRTRHPRSVDDVPRFDAASGEPLPMGVTMLEASAGTGKTYSIASLVLRLVVEERLGIDEILVVTFTEAATSELRDRVRRRLRDALTLAERTLATGALPAGAGGAARDEVGRALVTRAIARGALADMVTALRTALGRFDDAPITTIHGFCHRVLRERAFECGGELEAELLTDDTALLDAVVRDFWARETAARPVALVEALVARARVGLAPLGALARRAVRHPESACMPALDDVDGASLEALLTERARLADDLAGRWNADDTSEALALIGAAREGKVLSGTKWRADSLDTRARAVSTWAAGSAAADPLPVKELAYFGAAGLRDACNKGKAPPAHSLFDCVDALLKVDAEVQGAAISEALRLQHACVAWARTELARRKRVGRVHGFDDLLRLVCGALRRDDAGTLAAALRASFRAALIDEFQDTDDVQWEIFRRAFATPGHRLVLIGDPKQSIYAFRGADVEAYLAARGAAATRWALDANWRTDGALVDALHALWGAHPAPFAEREIGWRRVRASHAARRLQGAGAPLRFRFLAREGALAPTGTSALITKDRLLPRLPTLVANDVARWLGSGATIVERVGGHDRPRSVRPADVAVLVRSHRQARDVQAALRRAGVPAVIHGAESVFASREARELIAVLAAVLEPASPSLARAALATDLLGLAAAAELPDDGAPRGPGDLLAAVDADDARWDTWAERLRAWRAAWRGGESASAAGAPVAGAPGIMRLVRALCDELALPARLLALVDGERRLTNLLHLGELLHAASTERALAPGATLAWLREQVANADAGRDDAARQLRLESDDEAARVVTVHSSKGLEYGAVWCPYLWDGRLSLDADLAFPHVPVAGATTRARSTCAAAGARPRPPAWTTSASPSRCGWRTSP